MGELVRKWEPEHDELLCKLYNDGMRIADIAAEINSKFGTTFTPVAIRSRAACRLGLRRETRQNTVWTDDRQAELERCMSEGMSYREAGDAMGATRNAIGGQARKLGLQQSEEDARRDREIMQAIRERRKEGERYASRMSALMNWVPREYRQEAPLPIFCSVVDDPLNLSMAAIGPDQCRYIMNDDAADPKFCGHSTTRKSWCARHAEVVLA